MTKEEKVKLWTKIKELYLHKRSHLFLCPCLDNWLLDRKITYAEHAYCKGEIDRFLFVHSPGNVLLGDIFDVDARLKFINLQISEATDD